jgi:AraC-like DNA-binding protein
MRPDLERLMQEGFHVSTGLPAGYEGTRLAGSEVVTARGNAGLLVFQEFQQPHYAIQLSVFELPHPFALIARQSREMLVSFLALKNNIRYTIQGLAPFLLRKGQFALLHTTEADMVAQFDKGRPYQHLEIAWSPDIVNQLLPIFPSIEAILSIPKTGSFFIGKPGRNAGPAALQAAHALLHTPHEENIRNVLFEYKVREQLLFLLEQSGLPPPPKMKITVQERNRLLALGEELSREPAKQFPITNLARETNMNEMKLKIAFKELFGRSIFEYHMEERMQEAHRLLEEEQFNTKEIAARVGYGLTTSFIQKFQERFGYSPSQYKKRKK